MTPSPNTMKDLLDALGPALRGIIQDELGKAFKAQGKAESIGIESELPSKVKSGGKEYILDNNKEIASLQMKILGVK